MATIVSTLYPPLIDTFMPAFLWEGPAPVTFSFSPYNSMSRIQRIHVSLVNQKTNQSAFENSSKAVSNGEVLLDNIWIIPFSENGYSKNGVSILTVNTTNNTCTINIPKELLKGKKTGFVIDNYYKVQIRLDEAIGFSDISKLPVNFLSNNRQYFSEWSSVCLIKAIPRVEIGMIDFDTEYSDVNNSNVISKIRTVQAGIVPILGSVIFTDGASIYTKNEETLQKYNIKIVSDATSEIIDETKDWVYTNNNEDPNRIYWLADLTNGQPDSLYTVYIEIVTKNQYKFQKKYQLKIANFDTITFNPRWEYENIILNYYGEESTKIITEEDGILTFKIVSDEEMPQGYLYVKRATSLDNFKKWELISCTEFVGKLNKTIIDPTIGSLIKYRYSCQFRLKKSEAWTKTKFSPDFVYPDYYDMLIYRDGRQLALRYNTQVTSYSSVINRQVINTLGSKYPKFAENAQMNYKKFTISGLLTSEADFNRKFLNDRDYADEMNDYDEFMGGRYEVRNDTISDGTHTYSYGVAAYSATQVATQKLTRNTLHDLAPKDNWWLERKFRDEALNWLNDGEPKLFKSMTEGNLVVMLTDISLTPNTQVGRRTYNISMTAYEIEDGYSLNVLSSLGIITVPNEYSSDMESGMDPDESGESESESSTKVTMIGQLNKKRAVGGGSGGNLIYVHGQLLNTSIVEDYTIDDYYNGLYYQGALSAYKVVDGSYRLKDLKIQFLSYPQWYDVSTKNRMTSTSNKDNLIYGYKLGLIPYLGSKTPTSPTIIFVEEKGYYQIPSNLVLSGVYLYDEAVATLDYKLTYRREYDETSIPSSAEIAQKIVGQLSGKWYSGQRIADEIKNKYEYYYYYTVSESSEKKGYNGLLETQYLDKITAFGFDGTTYAILGIRFENEPEENIKQFVVGRTGVYNLMTNFPIEDVTFIGRRMFRKDNVDYNSYAESQYKLHPSTQYYQGAPVENFNWTNLDTGQSTDVLIIINGNVSQPEINQINKNWIEPDLNVLPFNSINDIVAPEKNTIYAVYQEEDIVLMLYTNENNWVQVDFINEENHTIMYADAEPQIVKTGKKKFFLEDWEFSLDESATEIENSNLNWYKTWLKRKTSDEVSINGTFNICHFIIDVNNPDIPILDGYESEEDILNPEYNTVYKFKDNIYKIYYIDQGWYDVEFVANSDKSLIIARVPVYGMVNYRGNLVKIKYD